MFFLPCAHSRSPETASNPSPPQLLPRKWRRNGGWHPGETCPACHRGLCAPGAQGINRPTAIHRLVPHLLLLLHPCLWEAVFRTGVSGLLESEHQLRCQGTRGQGRQVSLPAGSTEGAMLGRRRGGQGPGWHRLWLGHCCHDHLNPSIQPWLLFVLLAWMKPSFSGSFKTWRCICRVMFSLLHRIQFLGKAHKLRLGPIHTET